MAKVIKKKASEKPRRGRKPGWGKGLTRHLLLLVTPEKHSEIRDAAVAESLTINEWVRRAIDARLDP